MELNKKHTYNFISERTIIKFKKNKVKLIIQDVQ